MFMSRISSGSQIDTTEISVRGKFRRVPAITLETITVVITGNLIRTGIIKGEAWLDPHQIEDPKRIIEELLRRKAPLDIFQFRQRLPENKLIYQYPYEWESIAAIPLTSFSDWWENRASQVTRKNVRRSAKRGVEVNPVAFDDCLIEAIVRINNDALFRTGRKFWHFGKDFAAVKKDYSAYLDRSEFLGAFYAGELIGFLRLVFQGDVASVMQLLNMTGHYDKRPSNALIAKAVDLCTKKGIKYLIYGQYIYDDNIDNPLTEFKRRNGFEEFLIPAYYVPFTTRGRVAIKLNLHAGLRRLIPKELMNLARTIRGKVTSRRTQILSHENLEKD